MPRRGGTTTKTPDFITCDGLRHALVARDPLFWRRAIRMAWSAWTGRRSCVRDDCSPTRPVMPHHAPLQRGLEGLQRVRAWALAGRAGHHSTRHGNVRRTAPNPAPVGSAQPSRRRRRRGTLGSAFSEAQKRHSPHRGRIGLVPSAGARPRLPDTNSGTRRAVAPTPPGRRPTACQAARPIVASIRPWGSSVGRNTVPGFSSPKGFRSIGT